MMGKHSSSTRRSDRMKNTDQALYIAMAGIPIAILSFLAYVFVPETVFILTFVIGLALFLIGYVRMYTLNKSYATAYRDRYEQMESEGFILSLDGRYVPCEDDATIEVLE